MPSENYSIAARLKARKESKSNIVSYEPIMKEAKRLPDDREIVDLSAEELASALIELKIPGASQENTMKANRALYEQFICRLYHEGGSEAVALWLITGEAEDDEADQEEP